MSTETELNRIYSRLPTIKCKKLCGQFCSMIMMTELEHKRIHEIGGNLGITERYLMSNKAITPGAWAVATHAMVCPALKDGLCSVYERRPMICRVFGLTKTLRCPYGCTPSHWLSERESRKLFM